MRSPSPVPASSPPPFAPSTPLLSVEGVAVERDGITLLSATTLRIDAGECVAVLGPNGAGKTTLLRVLAGRLPPSTGRAELHGFALDERRSEVRRQLSVLLEPPALYPDLTLGENLALVEAAWRGERVGAFGARAASDTTAAQAPLVAGLGSDALEMFGVAGLQNRFPDELSSGQRQLTSLAIAFARPASALLLDEPEQRLDPSRRSLLAEAMLAARERGVAIVFASHAPDLVDRVADRRLLVGG